MKQKKVTKLTLNKLTVANMDFAKGGYDPQFPTDTCVAKCATSTCVTYNDTCFCNPGDTAYTVCLCLTVIWPGNCQ